MSNFKLGVHFAVVMMELSSTTKMKILPQIANSFSNSRNEIFTKKSELSVEIIIGILIFCLIILLQNI